MTRPLSARFTLTAWYTSILVVMICALGAAMYFGVRHTIIRAADDNLTARMEEIGPFIAGRLHSKHANELPHEFEAHLAGLEPGGELLQVADSHRHWIYQSSSITGYGVALPQISEIRTPIFETLILRGSHLRIVSSTVHVDNQIYFVQLGQSLDPSFELLGRFRRLAFLILPLALILSWAGGYLLCRRALAPVDEITNAARSISTQNLNLRLPVPRTGDELQRLAETMNGMIVRLDGAFTKMSQFTADAAHELRTPISLILTTAELSMGEGAPANSYRAALLEIYAEAVRMKSLIEDLMTLARADSGEGNIQFSPVNLGEAVRLASTRGELLSKSKHIDFTTNIQENALWVRGDTSALQRLFLILIDNAVKFTPASGRISISLGKRDSAAIFEIADSGPGISEGERTRIFDRFYRVDPARSRNSGGAGLGLAIGRWIADQHRATIEIDGSGGSGAIFRVSIPLCSS